jgi:hypothetical protein
MSPFFRRFGWRACDKNASAPPERLVTEAQIGETAQDVSGRSSARSLGKGKLRICVLSRFPQFS